MEAINIALGVLFGTPAIFAAFAGVAYGIIGGAMPGISPSVAMALLVPFTFTMDPTTAIIMLASVYVGAEYGGSIPAILINTPGTNAAAATTIDGYALHQQGRGGEALGISLMAGVVGGLVGVIVLVALTGPLAKIALAFTPAAYFSLGILSLSVIASLTEGSLVKGLIMGVLGLMIATIGSDPISGVTRFTFGFPELFGGIHFVLVMMGVFAVSELFKQIGDRDEAQVERDSRIRLPKLRDWKRLWLPVSLGSALGTFEGITPGGGGAVASFLSYNEARRWSKHPEEFGKGSIEGIAAPEAANNTVAGTALIPTLSFGIPGSNSTAVLLGALLVHGMQPGPMLFQQNPKVMYGLYGGLFVANIAQLVIGLLIMTPCIWLVNRPKRYRLAAIYALVLSGVYSIDSSVLDLIVVLMAGVFGYVLKRLKFPMLPLVLGLMLGYMVESNFRRALLVSADDPMTFLQDKISLTLLILSGLMIFGSAIWPALKKFMKNRRLASH
jgi:putative tricarboxylic transport membrane protein